MFFIWLLFSVLKLKWLFYFCWRGGFYAINCTCDFFVPMALYSSLAKLTSWMLRISWLWLSCIDGFDSTWADDLRALNELLLPKTRLDLSSIGYFCDSEFFKLFAFGVTLTGADFSSSGWLTTTRIDVFPFFIFLWDGCFNIVSFFRSPIWNFSDAERMMDGELFDVGSTKLVNILAELLLFNLFNSIFLNFSFSYFWTCFWLLMKFSIVLYINVKK